METTNLGDIVLPASLMNAYQAQGNKEKLAYRKGFEAAVNLLIESWDKESRDSFLIKAETIMGVLTAPSNYGRGK